MPIIGVIASSTQQGISTTAYDSINTVTVGSGGASSIVFNNIPSTYKHLVCRVMSNLNYGVNDTDRISVAINGNNLNQRHLLYGTSSSAQSYSDAGNAIGPTMLSGSFTQYFGGSIWEFLDYAETTKNKTVRVYGGTSVSSAVGASGNGSIRWASTSAITQLTFTGSANFRQYSTIALYGITG